MATKRAGKGEDRNGEVSGVQEMKGTKPSEHDAKRSELIVQTVWAYIQQIMIVSLNLSCAPNLCQLILIHLIMEYISQSCLPWGCVVISPMT